MATTIDCPTESELTEKYAYIVRSWAKHYKAKSRRSIILDDLISWGNQGLIVGLRSYKPEKGTIETHLNNKVRFSILDGLREWLGKDFQDKYITDSDISGPDRGSFFDSVPERDERQSTLERARAMFDRGSKVWRNLHLDARDKQMFALAFRERLSVVDIGKLFRKADKSITDDQVQIWLECAVDKLAKKQHTPINVCCVDGCKEPYHRQGFCKSHYVCVGRNGSTVHKRLPNAPDGCKFKGCRNKHYARSLCITHWQIANDQREDKVACKEDGCERAAIAKGFCNSHYNKNYRLIHGRKPWRKAKLGVQ